MGAEWVDSAAWRLEDCRVYAPSCAVAGGNAANACREGEANSEFNPHARGAAVEGARAGVEAGRKGKRMKSFLVEKLDPQVEKRV